MSPDRRREMIIRTALPLVAEHGAAVTTGQVAWSAGIGEATIFRVFADKEELLDACVAEAMRTDHVLAEIAEIPLDQPLPARLAEASAAIEAYLARMGMVIGALHATGRVGGAHGAGGRGADGRGGNGRDTGGRGGEGRGGGGRGGGGRGAHPPGERDASPSGERDAHAPGDRDNAMSRTRDALTDLFEPERDRLRLPPDQVADMFMGMAFTRARPPAGPDAPHPSLEDALDVFLHGALKEGTPR